MNKNKFLYPFFGFYLLLLALTWFIHFNFPFEEQAGLNQESSVIFYDDREISIDYSIWENEHSKSVIVLFPDHLHKKKFLIPLAESLHENSFSVILLDYPKSDTDGKTISNSTVSRAHYTGNLLEELGVENTHLLGQGYGGLVLAQFSSLQLSTGIQSITLLASYGVEELHFLGNETINRSLYTLLYPAVFTFKYLTPHLGWYNHQTFNFEFVRSQRSMNQREMRDLLLSINEPALILHPKSDRYISAAISEENHRLLPQSYYVSVKGDHQTISKDPEIFTRQLSWFLQMVENNELETRDQADKSRIDRSLQPFDADEIDNQSNWAIFIIIMLLALISLVSEDLACISGGLLVASGIISFWIAVLGGAIGIITADILTYLLGRWIGKPILEKVPFKWIIKPEDVKKAEQMFEMNGVGIIFATRFLPGTRFPTYLVAGILRIKFIFFIGYFLLAVAIWAPLLVGITVLVGQPMIEYLQIYQEYAWMIIIGIIVLIFSLIKFVLPLTTVRGRRRFMIKWANFKDRWTAGKN